MTANAPLLARTRTIHRPVGPMAYDCVKVIVVRDGSAILFSEFGQQPVTIGDVILLGANTLCGSPDTKKPRRETYSHLGFYVGLTGFEPATP